MKTLIFSAIVTIIAVTTTLSSFAADRNPPTRRLTSKEKKEREKQKDEEAEARKKWFREHPVGQKSYQELDDLFKKTKAGFAKKISRYQLNNLEDPESECIRSYVESLKDEIEDLVKEFNGVSLYLQWDPDNPGNPIGEPDSAYPADPENKVPQGYRVLASDNAGKKHIVFTIGATPETIKKIKHLGVTVTSTGMYLDPYGDDGQILSDLTIAVFILPGGTDMRFDVWYPTLERRRETMQTVIRPVATVVQSAAPSAVKP